MAHISKISFASVDTLHGCTCDRCGQWIKNIITVDYDDGLTLHYGMDCYEKLWTSNRLNDFGKKLMRKTLKSLARYEEQYQKYVSGEMTAENDPSWQATQYEWSQTYWTGRPYEEYKQWMIEEWYPQRFKDCQKEVDKFSKVDWKER